MALTRTEIDRAYLQRHNLKRFNLMAAEDVLKRFKEIASIKGVRPGEMLEILLDSYQQRPKKEHRKEEVAAPAAPAPKTEQMALF